MRKVLFLFAVFALGYAVLGGFEGYQNPWDFDSFSGDRMDSAAYIAKYRDCIDQGSFPEGLLSETSQVKKQTSGELNEQSTAMAVYAKELEATLRNLSHLEAHNHIHQEFKRSLDRLLHPGLGDSQKQYYREVMKLCYESDRALNLGTARQL